MIKILSLHLEFRRQNSGLLVKIRAVPANPAEFFIERKSAKNDGEQCIHSYGSQDKPLVINNIFPAAPNQVW